MINYNQGIPMYWRDETSGKMAIAVEKYFAKATGESKELTSDDLSFLRMYLCHWSNAPAYKNNPHATKENLAELESAIELCNSIEDYQGIEKAIAALLDLGIDPF